MNRRDYWHGRYLQIRAANELSTIQFEQSMLTTVDALNTKINGELVDWYKRYSRTAKVDFGTSAEILKKVRTEGWHQTLDEFQRLAIQGGHTDELDMEYIRSQTARLEQLQTQLVSMIAPVLPELTNSMSDEMVEQYRYQYEHAMYLNEMASGNTGNFATFDEASLKLVVAKPWQGGNFSQRLWGNFQSTLPNMLMQTLAESVVLGRNPSRLARELAKTHKHFTESNLHRLINTEMAHIDESANYQALVDIDAEYYEHLATLENHTCEICAHLDGKHFKLSERVEGVNYAVLHPHCRCDDVYWEPNMPAVGKRWSKDPVTGKRKMVDDITFDEWKLAKSMDFTEQAQSGKGFKVTKKSKSNALSVDRKLVNSKVYYDRFEKMPIAKPVSDSMHKWSMWALEHRDGTEQEDIFVINEKGSKVTENISSSQQFGVSLSDENAKIIQNSSQNLYYLHSHPEGGRPSYRDLVSAVKAPNIVGSATAGHDGSVNLVYNLDKRWDVESDYRRWYDEFKKSGFPDQEANLRATDELYKSGRFDYYHEG